jgi:tetratricopeptide (TPR) repeat protein
MNSSRRPVLVLLLLVSGLGGCSELRGRHRAREGNRLYLEGNYAAAVREYEAAEQFVPKLAPVVLNKGLAYRQLMVPGAKTPTNDRYVQGALDAFKRLGEISPGDPRADQLYVQTLFDADRFDALAERYQRDLQTNPKNLAAINGLVQVYSRWDRWDDALKWAERRADIESHDAEAQYSVGVFIWNRLFQRGGSGDKATYNPRAEPKQAPPPFGEGDIVGEQRVQLAEQGIRYLQRALAIRPSYREAMTYLNLLYRQKSIAFFDRPDDWKAAIDAAEKWRLEAAKLDSAHAGTGH